MLYARFINNQDAHSYADSDLQIQNYKIEVQLNQSCINYGELHCDSVNFSSVFF